MADNWDDIADWWRDEVDQDPAYGDDVHPMLRDLLPERRGLTVDLGCGEGQGMRLIGGAVVGVDLSARLLATARHAGPVVAAELPSMDFFQPSSFDLAISVYLVDLLEDCQAFFESTFRIVHPGGSLVIVINHPTFTAPGSGPFMDDYGDVMWRWGTYLTQGSSLEAAGDREIRFHHRPMADLLNAASAAGWRLDAIREHGLSPETIARFPDYSGQDHIPRLLGVRWSRPGSASIGGTVSNG